jgi:hypothetical protein
MIISNSDSNGSFTENIDYDINNEPLDDVDPDWIQFVQDHREYITTRSTLVEITPNEMVYYKYRIRKYLTYKGYNPGLEMAFRTINHLRNNNDFDEDITKVYLPNSEVLNELRRSYKTLQSQIKKL